MRAAPVLSDWLRVKRKKDRKQTKKRKRNSEGESEN